MTADKSLNRPPLTGLTDQSDRHVVLDRRPGRYLSFPDIVRLPSGRVVCAYRESGQHVPDSCRLLVRTSDDQGRVWSEARELGQDRGHCPSLVLAPDGQLFMFDDRPRIVYVSPDGESFREHPANGFDQSMASRVIFFPDGAMLTTGHTHRCHVPDPWTGQPVAEQVVFRSPDGGRNWQPRSIMTFSRELVLCEASMIPLPDGSILSLLRENSFVYEPMYWCLSRDRGDTWTAPRPFGLIGHRPRGGLTRDGRLLVTYRDVGPDGGTKAWLGTPEEAMSLDHQPHGVCVNGASRTLTAEGLRVEVPSCRPGLKPEDPEFRFRPRFRLALRPLTDPGRVRATLEAEVRVIEGQPHHCGILFGGVWWLIRPDGLTPQPVLPPSDDSPYAAPDAPDQSAFPADADGWVRLRLEMAGGRVSLIRDGQEAFAWDIRVWPLSRAVIVGNGRPDSTELAGTSLIRVLRLVTHEPMHERDFRFEWDASQGEPDAYVRTRVLELMNDRLASFGDYGYSGWTELDEDGRFLCAYHHSASHEPEYRAGRSAHVLVTAFGADDFV